MKQPHTVGNPTNVRLFFLTTCYPTSTTGTDGNNGIKSAKEEVVSSRND